MNIDIKKIKVLNYDVELTKNTIKIYNSNKITNNKMMLAILLKIRNRSPFTYTRTNRSFMIEWIYLNKLNRIIKIKKLNNIVLKDNPSKFKKFINRFLKNKKVEL